jgi:hypothetical protein
MLAMLAKIKFLEARSLSPKYWLMPLLGIPAVMYWEVF